MLSRVIFLNFKLTASGEIPKIYKFFSILKVYWNKLLREPTESRNLRIKFSASKKSRNCLKKSLLIHCLRKVWLDKIRAGLALIRMSRAGGG